MTKKNKYPFPLGRLRRHFSDRPGRVVYLIVNVVNSKAYVGISERGTRTRWNGHLRSARHGSRYPLHCAIRKYGPRNFCLSVLAMPSTQEQAKQSEIFWISKLGTYGPKGYNATTGGDGTHGLTWNAARKIKQLAAFNLPTVKDRHRAATRAAVNTPLARYRKSEALKKAFALPGSKQRRCAIQRQAQLRPEVVAKRSAAIKAAHARPGVKERHRLAIIASWKTRKGMPQ